MTKEDRIAAFEKLGQFLSAIDADLHLDILDRARNENPWFTPENVNLSLKSLSTSLTLENLQKWTAQFPLEPVSSRTVAIVMAGNIPLVGFHDFLCVLISGHNVQIKLSSKDTFLINFIIKTLLSIEPRFRSKVEITDRLANFDAVVATGSDNTARYFHFYFGKYPNIIRKNRSSVAVLSGKETDEELYTLGKDVFSYFGLGCRNVSKIFVPQSFDVTRLLKAWEPYHDIIHHHKYNNNYDYQKSLLLINRVPFLDSLYVLLQESDKLVSPISVVYYERYEDEGNLALKLMESKDKIQCIVSTIVPGGVPFGQAQSPKLWDYADQIDTLKFLESLN
jgi:hypothetical protein